MPPKFSNADNASTSTRVNAYARIFCLCDLLHLRLHTCCFCAENVLQKRWTTTRACATDRQWLFKRQRTCAAFLATDEVVCVKRFFPPISFFYRISTDFCLFICFCYFLKIIFIVFNEKKKISNSFPSILCLTVIIKWVHLNSYTSLVFLFRPVDQLKP